MKKIVIAILMYIPLFVFAHYCDSQSRPNVCFQNNVEMNQGMLNNNLKKILSSPYASPEYKKAIIADQRKWEMTVNNGCRGDARCVNESLEERVMASGGLVLKLEAKGKK